MSKNSNNFDTAESQTLLDAEAADPYKDLANANHLFSL